MSFLNLTNVTITIKWQIAEQPQFNGEFPVQVRLKDENLSEVIAKAIKDFKKESKEYPLSIIGVRCTTYDNGKEIVL